VTSFADRYKARTGHAPFEATTDPEPGTKRLPGHGPKPSGSAEPDLFEDLRDPPAAETKAPDPEPIGVIPETEILEPETDLLSPYYQGPVDSKASFGYAEVGLLAIDAGEKHTGGTQTMDTRKPLFTFRRAEKKQGKLRVAFMGPSGSGKTLSALLVAQGIGKKIFVIDTENYSASDYADRVTFEVACIEPPYTVAKYLAAMEQAEEEGADVIIVDSLSHAWAGDGGLLEQKDILDANNPGKSFQNWAKISPIHARLVSKILQNQRHLICTVRAESKYTLEQQEGGGTKVKKLGLEPIFRKGIEFEFTIAFHIHMSHHAEIAKDRTSLYDGQLVIPTIEMGQRLLAWRMDGKERFDGDMAIVQATPSDEAAASVTPGGPGNGRAESKPAEDRPTDAEYDTLRTIGQNLDPKKAIGVLAREAGFKMPITGKEARTIIDKYAGVEASAQ
jgi:hypothetical protein